MHLNKSFTTSVQKKYSPALYKAIRVAYSVTVKLELAKHSLWQGLKLITNIEV